MFSLVNVHVSPPKPLDVAASNLAKNALVRSKAGIYDGVPSTNV